MKNSKIIEYRFHIWNQHGKWIQMSTNMPGVGLVNHEIGIKILKTKRISHNETNGHVCAKALMKSDFSAI